MLFRSLYANGKIYFNELKNRLKRTSLDISQDITVKRGSISIRTEEKCIIMTIYEYLSIKYKKGF